MKSNFLKYLVIIIIAFIVIGSISGTLVYFFITREKLSITFKSNGFVRLSENNQTTANIIVDLYALNENQTYEQIQTTISDETGYYLIARTFHENNSIVQQQSFLLIAYENEKLFDFNYYNSFGNYTNDFFLKTENELELEGKSFPFREPSHLTYSFYSVLPVQLKQPEIAIEIGVNDTSSASLEIFDNEVKVHSTTILNNDSIQVTLPSLKTNGTHSLKLKIIPSDTNREWVLETFELTSLFWCTELKKIAYFIKPVTWDSSPFRKESLEDHGFSVKFFKSPNEWEPIIHELDKEEDENTIIFLGLIGHGNFIPYADNDTGDSYVTVNPEISLKIYSSALRNQILTLESKRILIMAESCYSGGFKDDLQYDGISILTSSDTEHTSNSNFAFRFFEGVEEQNMDNMTAFEYSCQFFDGYHNQIANPQAYWGSWHSFFAP